MVWRGEEMNANQLSRIVDYLALERGRASPYSTGVGDRTPFGDARSARQEAVSARESNPRHSRPFANRAAGQVPGHRSHHQGVAVSHDFKIGLAVMLALAVGSLLYHLLF